MNPEAVAASYDQIADRWDGDEFPRENGMEAHRRALTFVKEPGAALDVGCGSSGRFIDLLLSKGFAPEGLDLSVEMLKRARRRHPDVLFHHADITTWPLPHPYRFVTAWDSIWHVPLDLQDAVLRKLIRGLEPGGVLIFTMGGLPGPDERRDAAMGPPMYHATLGVPAVLDLLREEGVVIRNTDFDQTPEQHLYLIVQAPTAAAGE